MDSDNNQRGKFIDFEYIDGGEAMPYITKISHEFFPNNGVVYEREPTNGTFGGPINNILSRDSGEDLPNWRVLAHGFLADRFDHINKNSRYGIRQTLARGVPYICDRYNLSTYAYQIPLEEFDWFYTCSKEILIPDLTVYLRYDLESCVKKALASVENSILYRKANEDEANFRLGIEKTDATYIKAIEFLKKKPKWQNIHIIDVHNVYDTWDQLRPLVKDCLEA